MQSFYAICRTLRVTSKSYGFMNGSVYVPTELVKPMQNALPCIVRVQRTNRGDRVHSFVCTLGDHVVDNIHFHATHRSSSVYVERLGLKEVNVTTRAAVAGDSRVTATLCPELYDIPLKSIVRFDAVAGKLIVKVISTPPQVIAPGAIIEKRGDSYFAITQDGARVKVTRAPIYETNESGQLVRKDPRFVNAFVTMYRKEKWFAEFQQSQRDFKMQVRKDNVEKAKKHALNIGKRAQYAKTEIGRPSGGKWTTVYEGVIVYATPLEYGLKQASGHIVKIPVVLTQIEKES